MSGRVRCQRLHLAATVIASGVGLTLICSTAALLGTGLLDFDGG